MIQTNDTALFALAVELLKSHASTIRHFRGRFIQIFFALKCFQNEIPSMWSGRYIGTDVLQTLLDDLYNKASKPLTACVWSMGSGNFLARSGIINAGKNSTSQNTWRNNFNLQKGLGCYAPPQDLSSQPFLDEPRVQCRYLVPLNQGELRGATCRLCQSGKVPRYRREDHRKWLKISPDSQGYATVDLRNIANFAPDVAPGGTRIPLFPLLVALYHDTLEGLPVSGRTQVGLIDFATDFNFTQSELDAYFDVSITNPMNSAIIKAKPGSTIATPSARLDAAAPSPTPVVISPEPIAMPTHIAPPLGNTGWDAERFVQQALEDARWRVTDVTRQKLGYDLYAERGSHRRYIEVKSSINLCRPVFTAREWQQARAQRRSYVVAIIENFNPGMENVIYWVPDPTSCTAREAMTWEYAVARSAWSPAAVDLVNI